MVQRRGGARRKTRQKFMKSARTKGKISITRFLQEFKPGEKVILLRESSVQSGVYHKRFHAKVGKIVEKKGRCYNVEISDIGVKKILIVHPVHLKKQ